MYNVRNGRVLFTAQAPPVPPVHHPPPGGEPPGIAASDIEFNQTSGAFVIASDSQEGFITWKPGTQPVATRAQCDGEGTVTNDGRLFACISGLADTLSLWNVSQRRMIRQILLPDYVTNPQQTSIA